MSNIAKAIHEKWMNARMNRLELVATALNTYVADIRSIGKNQRRDITDEDCISVLKKHLKGVEETIALMPPGTAHRFEQEKEVILSLLPSQLSSQEIRTIIAQNQFLSVKEAMPYFKHHYAGRYDGKMVAEAFR